MAGHPTASELVAAVQAFLKGLPLNSRDMFHARVAANALAIVERELAAPPVPVVFGLSDASLCAAIRAGAYDFLSKPIAIDALEIALRRAAQHRALHDQVARLKRIAARCRSAAMNGCADAARG